MFKIQYHWVCCAMHAHVVCIYSKLIYKILVIFAFSKCIAFASELVCFVAGHSNRAKVIIPAYISFWLITYRLINSALKVVSFLEIDGDSNALLIGRKISRPLQILINRRMRALMQCLLMCSCIQLLLLLFHCMQTHTHAYTATLEYISFDNEDTDDGDNSNNNNNNHGNSTDSRPRIRYEKRMQSSPTRFKISTKIKCAMASKRTQEKINEEKKIMYYNKQCGDRFACRWKRTCNWICV